MLPFAGSSRTLPTPTSRLLPPAMAAQVASASASSESALWAAIEEKAADGTMTAIEHLLYTSYRAAQAKLADSERQNEELWLELEKFLRVPESPQAVATGSDDDADAAAAADAAEPANDAPSAEARREAEQRELEQKQKQAAIAEKARLAAEAERRAQAEAEAEEAANAEMLRYLQKDLAAPRGGLDIHNILA